MAKCNESLLWMGTFQYTVSYYVMHMNLCSCSASVRGNKVSLYFTLFCIQEPTIEPQPCVHLECTSICHYKQCYERCVNINGRHNFNYILGQFHVQYARLYFQEHFTNVKYTHNASSFSMDDLNMIQLLKKPNRVSFEDIYKKIIKRPSNKFVSFVRKQAYSLACQETQPTFKCSEGA